MAWPSFLFFLLLLFLGMGKKIIILSAYFIQHNLLYHPLNTEKGDAFGTLLKFVQKKRFPFSLTKAVKENQRQSTDTTSPQNPVQKFIQPHLPVKLSVATNAYFSSNFHGFSLFKQVSLTLCLLLQGLISCRQLKFNRLRAQHSAQAVLLLRCSFSVPFLAQAKL